MATGFKMFEASLEGVLARRSKAERDKMNRNAAAATERLKAVGDFTTEVQEIRRRRRREHLAV